MIYIDRRMGGTEERFLGLPPDYGMRHPDRFRDCVCFLYVEAMEGGRVVPSYGGTGFFVSIEESGEKFVYLVTARHCVRQGEGHGGLFARFTDNNGDTQTIRLGRLGEWACPEDPNVDVAVTLFAHGPHVVQAAVVERVLATRERLDELHVGPGDDVAVVGLFTQHSGKAKNLPIVRSGVIAAMPDEDIFDAKTGQSFAAYLVEVRSIGGLSGSPVFVNIGYARAPDGTINEAGRNYIIGVIRGHWDHKSPLDTESVSPSDALELRNINMGMATVTPISEVISLLYSEKLMPQRKSHPKADPEAPGHVDDSAFGEVYPPSRRGPEPERLKIGEPMDRAVKKMFKKGKPPKNKA